jgi:hypothetical protein
MKQADLKARRNITSFQLAYGDNSSHPSKHHSRELQKTSATPIAEDNLMIDKVLEDGP